MSKGTGAKIAIKFTENLSGDITGLAKPVGWQMGDDIAIGAVAITAGSVFNEANSADKALDRDYATSWRPAYRVLSWLKIDMGEIVAAKGWGMRTPTTSGYPSSYRIEGSNDDSNWDVILPDVYDAVGHGADVKREFTEVENYRYYRIVVTSRVSNYPGLAEFYLFGLAPVGNELAFTVTGTPIEPHLGEREYFVDNVVSHPSLGVDHILLTMNEINAPGGGRFCNVGGALKVAYDSAIGTLAGPGGPVPSFIKEFMPLDLVPVGPGYGAENLDVSIANYDIRNILPDFGYQAEILEVSIANYSLYLIDPEDP